LDEQGNLVGYAGCMYCMDVLRHDPHISGTSSLISHLRTCSAAGVLPAHAMMIPEVHVKEEVLEESRNNEEWDIFTRTTDICAEYVANDMLSYQCLTGNGFRKLAQFMVDCGAMHGKFEVDSVLPSTATVAKRVCARAGEERLKLRAALCPRLLHGSAVTLHTLTADRHSHLIALTVHYVKDCSVGTDFLGVCDFSGDAPTKMKDEVLRFLGKFGFETTPERMTLITSGESPLNAKWKEATMIKSFSYMINQSVNQLLKQDNQTAKEISINLEKFREIIRLINRENMKVSKLLEMDLVNSETDWRDTLKMVERVCRARSELLTVIQEQRLRESLSTESEGQMRHLITLLSPFKTAVEDMECCEVATLHKVVPWLVHLRDTCACSDGDTGALVILKEAMMRTLDQNEDLHLLHKVAVFFNPRMNSLRTISQEDRELVRKEVKRLAQAYIEISEPRRKKAKQESSPLSYLEDEEQHQDEESVAEREILLYTIMKDYTDSDNLLLWWQHNSTMLPLLAAVARKVLAIPASTTPTAHFSKIVRKIKDLGSSWGNEHSIDDLVFLHSRLSRLSANIEVNNKSSSDG
ncbi:hypothetical protein OTU49_003317, partial [Cherax quadricarinatus]